MDQSTDNPPLARLLRWAGSKTRSAKWILPLLDQQKLYIEPFCGSATFFFDGRPRRALLNDTNEELINFYYQAQERPEEMWLIYDAIEVSQENYYSIRDLFNGDCDPLERAAFFLFLNHFGFNGIYRTNMKGKMNTPFGDKAKFRKKIPQSDLLHYSGVLRRADLNCQDFEEFLRSVQPKDACIYMDPPYFTNDSRVFGEYGVNTFKGSDLERLFDVARDMRDKGNRVVISYKDCSEFRKLFSNFISSEFFVQRNVGGFAGRRGQERELIAVM